MTHHPTWYDEICIIDREANTDLKRIADFAAEHIAKRQKTEQPQYLSNNTAPQRFSPHPASGANAIQNSDQNTFRSQGNYNTANQNNCGTYRTQSEWRTPRCPKLLQIECDLLDKHDGCRKCRRFYVGHRVPNCENGFPQS